MNYLFVQPKQEGLALNLDRVIDHLQMKQSVQGFFSNRIVINLPLVILHFEKIFGFLRTSVQSLTYSTCLHKERKLKTY